MFQLRIRLLFLLLVSCFMSVSYGASNAYSPSDTIKAITVGSTGHLYVVSTGARINPNGCISSGAYALDANHPVKKMYLTVLTTAWAANRKATMLISGTECVGAYPKIILVGVTK